jgi:general secretion pathway protein B
MSYILEALKKADADRERERSAVPSLHAHTDALGFERERRGGAALGAKLAVGAALLLAGGGAAWWWTAAPSTNDERPTVSATPAPAAVPAPAPVPQAPQPVAVAPAAPPPLPTPAQAPSPIVAPPAPVPPPPRKAAAAAAPPTAATPAPRPPAEARLPTRNELAPELRAALPPLNVSGAVYAPSPSARLLFVNGLVLHEGDVLSDGLTVERIGRASSVLAFRGQRFELKH